MIEDGDLLKEDKIGPETTQYGFKAVQRRNKLKTIKETNRKLRAYIKGEARGTLIRLGKDQHVLTADNYEVNNTHGVIAFCKNQKNLVRMILDEIVIENVKG